MTKRFIIGAVALIVAATAFVFVYPMVDQAMQNCDDFPAPVIAGATDVHLTLTCMSRVTFNQQEYFGGCMDVHESRLGPFLAKDLAGPRLREGVVTAIRALRGVAPHQAILVVVEGKHSCREGTHFTMFSDSLGDIRYDQMWRSLRRPLHLRRDQ